MALSRYFRLLLALTVVGAPAAAQTAPTCRQAAERARSGAATEDELAVLLGCRSERGPALAEYLRRLARVAHPAALQTPFGYANVLRDRAVFGALHSVARDPGAAAAARVYSILALIYQEAGATGLDYQAVTSVGEDEICSVGKLDDGEQAVVSGAPLPADHSDQSRALAKALAADASAPSSVRSAGRCLLAATGPGVGDDVAVLDTGPVNPDAIQLDYVCGSTFRVRNANPRDVLVDFEVEGTAIRAKLGLPGNPHRGAGYSEITFAVPQAGTVRLLLNGAVVETATSKKTPCT
jgi:hypothetical protein